MGWGWGGEGCGTIWGGGRYAGICAGGAIWGWKVKICVIMVTEHWSKNYKKFDTVSEVLIMKIKKNNSVTKALIFCNNSVEILVFIQL